MQKKSFIWKHGLSGIALCAMLFCHKAMAQEIPARTQGLSLQAFGLVSYVQPHYGQSNNIGGSFGADLNFRPLYTFKPSLEVRATFAPGSEVGETTYDFGPRLEVDLGRLKPYATLLIGKGSITFAHPLIFATGPYTHDDSIVYSGVIGADYMVSRQIGVRGEAMVQSWNLGNSQATAVIFHPRLYSFGVDYRFDFNLIGRRRR